MATNAVPTGRRHARVMESAEILVSAERRRGVLPRLVAMTVSIVMAGLHVADVRSLPATAAELPIDLPAELLFDVETGTESSQPKFMQALPDGKVFFAARDAATGQEPYVWDPTLSDVVSLGDLNPGPNSSMTLNVGPVFEGHVYFSAATVDAGSELWRSDGTVAGTELVADIVPGEVGSNPVEYLEFDGSLYFGATTPDEGRELWRTDGTSAGTELVADLFAGTEGGNPRQFRVARMGPTTSALFVAADLDDGSGGTLGRELVRVDADGTVTEYDIRAGSDESNPTSLRSFAGDLFFVASSPGEVMRARGAEPATMTLTPLALPDGGSPLFLARTTSHLFVMSTDASGLDLWAREPDEPPVEVVSGFDTLSLANAVGATLIFGADDGNGDGPGIWASDGAASSGERLVDAIGPIRPAAASVDGSIAALRVSRAGEPTDDTELWRSDGTALGTHRIVSGRDYLSSLATVSPLADGGWVFAGQENDDIELWASDDAVDDGARIADVNRDERGSTGRGWAAVGDDVWFIPSADDRVFRSRADGTAGSMTTEDELGLNGLSDVRILDLGDHVALVEDPRFGSDPRVWFADADADSPAFVETALPASVVGGSFLVQPEQMADDVDTVFFQTPSSVVAVGPTGVEEIVVDVGSIVLVGGDVVYIDDDESTLWQWSGAGAATRLLPVDDDTEFDYLLSNGARAISDGPSSMWTTDGTVAGTFDLEAPDRDGGAWADSASTFVWGTGSGTAWWAGGEVFEDTDVPFRPARAVDVGASTYSTDSDSIYRIDGSELERVELGSAWVGGGLSHLLGASSLDGSDEQLIFSTDSGGDRLVYATDGTEAGTQLIADGIDGLAALFGSGLFASIDLSDAGVEPHRIELDPETEPEPEPEPEPDEVVIESVVPGRVLETRIGERTIDDVASIERRVATMEQIEVPIAGRAGVPSDASAAVLNVTAIRPSGVGFLTIHPCSDQLPLASSLNYGLGDVVGNEVIVKLSAAGSVCIFSQTETDLTADVVGFAPALSAYAPIVPARLLDTRADGETIDGVGANGGPVPADSEVEVEVLGRGGVAGANVDAVVVNVTGIRASEGGYLTIHPCRDRPLASSLNYGPGTVAGNEVVAPVSDDGTICVYTAAQIDLTIDVVGYVPTGGTYVQRTPGRFVDTRSIGTTIDGISQGHGAVGANEVLEVQIQDRADVPGSAVGVVMNVTVIRPNVGGFLTVFPCGEPPLASSLNFGAGAVVGNEVVAKLSPDGTVCVRPSTATDLTVDVVGVVVAAD